MTLQEDMPNWVKEKGRPLGLGFDSMRKRVCQGQRRKREAEHGYDPARGYAKLSQRKGQAPELGFDSMREAACQSQRRKREAGLKFDSMRGRVFLGQRKGQVPRAGV